MTIKWRFLFLGIAIWSGLQMPVPVRAASLADDEVQIDATHILRVNGQDAIQRQLFGLTAYVGCPEFYTSAGTRFLDDHGIESLGLPGVFQWVLPKGSSALNSTADINSLFADPNGAHEYFYNYTSGDRYTYGRMLGNIRAADCEPWLYLIGELPGHTTKNGHIPTDYELWANMALAYVKLWRTADPQLRYVHIMNEPNAHWYEDQKTGSDYAQLFTTAATVLKKDFPDLQIGGPVLCWPPTWPPKQKDNQPWYTWESYSKPLLADKNLDFFDFHAYDIPAEALEGELHIITAQSVAHHDRWMTSAITETNFTLTKEQWQDRREHYLKRVVPMIRQTFMLLGNPDKVFCQQVHDLSGAASGWYRFWGNNDMKITPMEEFFAVCRPLRGTRLVRSVAQSLRKDVWIESAFGNRRLTIAVMNFAEEPRTVRLHLTGLKPEDIQTVHGQVLDVTSLRDEEGNSIFSQPTTMAPQSLHVWVVELKGELKPKDVRENREFFAKEVMQKLDTDQALAVRVPLDAKAQKDASAAAVRFGIKDQGSTEERWQIEVGSEHLIVDNPGPFVELPLAAPPEGTPVTIKIQRLEPFKAGEQPIFVSFVSLMLQQDR